MSASVMEQMQSAQLSVGDQFVVNLLRKTAAVSSQTEALVAAWREHGSAGESLADYLVRQDIFAAEAGKTLDMMRKGYVQFAGCEHLLRQGGAHRLEALLNRSAPRPTAPPAVRRSPPPPPPPEPEEEAPGKTQLLPRDPAMEWSRSTGRTQATNAADSVRTGGAIEVGMVLGRCLVTERIGQGASGMVYRALHQTLNIPVAVKVLHRSVFEQDPSVAEQLKREARLLAQLNHPNLIRVWDFQDDVSLPYVVLEYVEGMSLAELIEQSGKLRADRGLRFIAQAADGLAAGHKIGIVHRDVKPANILITKDGSCKVADLGLALVCSDQLKTSTGAAQEQLGLAGTAAYIAPEQIRDAGCVDGRSDIYALGATAYHAVTGTMPFRGRSAREVMFKHLREEPVPPHHLEPLLSPAASAAILKMMAKNPNDRFQTCEEVMVALASLALESSTRAAAEITATGATESRTVTARKSVWRRLLASFTRGPIGE